MVGCSNPAIIRRVVVLPQPDGPSIEKNSPCWMEKWASSTATKSWKRFVTWSISITASLADVAIVGAWCDRVLGQLSPLAAGHRRLRPPAGVRKIRVESLGFGKRFNRLFTSLQRNRLRIGAPWPTMRRPDTLPARSNSGTRELHRRIVRGGARRRHRRGRGPGHRRGHRHGRLERCRRRRPRRRRRDRGLRDLGHGDARGRGPRRSSPSPTPSRATSTTSSSSRWTTSASRRPSSSSSSTSPSTTSASSPVPPARMEAQAAGEYIEDHTSMLRRDPLGVVAGIAPWNYPLNMAIWKLGPALAAGNTFILKPSELTPLTALRLAELAADILPDGVFNVVTGQGETAGDASCATPASPCCRSPATSAPASSSPATPPTPSSACTSSSAARRRSWCSTTPTSRRWSSRPRRDRLLQLRPGLHRPVPRRRRPRRLRRPRRPARVDGRRHRHRRPGRPRHRHGPGHLRRPAGPGGRHGRAGRSSPAPSSSPVGPCSTAPASSTPPPWWPTRPRTASSCRREVFGPVDQRPALRRRGPGPGLGQRRRLRPGRLGVDPRRRPGHAHVAVAHVRHRVGQRPHPDRLGDAPRRLQEQSATARTCRSTPSSTTPS